MLKKGDKTRQFILAKSKELFSDKGYATITMKDICEVCELSRGGLYRYFSSTKEIFIEILNDDKEEKKDILEESILKNIPAEKLLKEFLEDRKNTKMVGADRGLSFAIHEFSHTEIEQQEYMIKRYEDAVGGLMSLLLYGQQQGVFKEFNLNVMAMHMLLLLDSLEISADMLQISEDDIDNQLELLYRMILTDNR